MALAGALAVVLAAVASPSPAAPPNIVLILVDDLGWADLSVHGARRIETPHIDALASQGVRFAHAYAAAPYCGPSRAALMTSRYPQRFGFEYNPEAGLRGERSPGLPAGERTLADELRAVGYETMLVGKWHLGFHPPSVPRLRGFDEFFGFLGSTHPYLEPARYDALFRNGKKTAESEFLTEAFAREAVAFVRRPRKKPFFLYLSFNAPHVPLEAPERYRERFGFVVNSDRRTYLAMVSALDDAIGAVLGAIDAGGLRDDTLVVFTNDNGGSKGNGASNAPLQGSKGTMWEGGIRVPLFVRWPARVAAGSRDERIVSLLDVGPTLVSAAGGPVAESGSRDGIDLALGVEARPAKPRGPLFWRSGRSSAVRDGPLKLVRHERRVGLYDLSADPGERVDLASDRPAEVARLRALYDAWEDTMSPPGWERPRRPFVRWRDEPGAG